MWHKKLRAVAVAGLVVLGGHAQQAQALTGHAGLRIAPAVASVAGGRYCYNWDFFNSSGGDATGLQFDIAGVSQVDATYAGVANPFGQPDSTSGYNSTTNVYALNFSNGTAFDGDKVHAGLCTNAAALSMSGASWKSNGQTVGDPPHYIGLHFNWLSPGQLRVELTNPLAVTATLMTLNVLQPEQPLALDDLNADVASQLPLFTEAITQPVTLASHGTFVFDLSFAQMEQLLLDQALVVDVVLSPEDDPDNVTHLVAQTLGQVTRVHAPLVLR